LNAGKTIVCLAKEVRAALRWPGIWILIARWTDEAVKTLLRPPFEQVARIEGIADIQQRWRDKEHYYHLTNGSRVYAFGFKTQSQDVEQRYGKIRGFAGSRIFVDQAEQLPRDIAEELRARLRPDIEAAHKGVSYPTQLTFSNNPTNHGSWLAVQFPAKGHIEGRYRYVLSLFDNEHNLPAASMTAILRTYPPDHPKYHTVVLGEDGPNIIGDAIYDAQFDRKAHVREIAYRDDMPLLEAFHFGTHNPVWLTMQRSPHGGMQFLGGLIGRHLMLDDFFPVVHRYRSEWFPDDADIRTCTGPMGKTSSGYTLLDQITAAHFLPISRIDGNSPDVRLAMIEFMGGELRRRTVAREEAVGVNADPAKWLSVDPKGNIERTPFLAFAFEGGYVWDEEPVSVGNKLLRQAYEDDEFANAMHCVEHLALNFCAGQETEQERERRERQQTQDALMEGPAIAGGDLSWLTM
jgi:hypothetical protein